MDIEKIKSIVESMLFAYGKSISIEQLSNIIQVDKSTLKSVILDLKNEYDRRDSGIRIVEIQDEFQFVTNKDNYDYLVKLFENRGKPNLSAQSLEVLSIIAYKNQTTKAEIEKIRGVNSDGIINKLLDYEIIEEAGKLDSIGKPMAYKVSNNFFRVFGIKSLSELPVLDINEEQLKVADQN